MNSKKGGIGGTVGMFVAVVAVILILTVFVLASGIVKKVSKVESGTKIHDESLTGLSNVISYMLYDYKKLLEVKVLVSQGRSVKESLSGVKYYDK